LRHFKNRREPECRTLSRAAVHAYGSPHEDGNLLADGEPQAGAAILACGGRIRLDKRGEQARDLVWPQSDAGIGDGETNGRLTTLLRCLDIGGQNHLTRACELDRIAYKVRQDLAKAMGITHQERRYFRRDPGIDLKSLGASQDAR